MNGIKTCETEKGRIEYMLTGHGKNDFDCTWRPQQLSWRIPAK